MEKAEAIKLSADITRALVERGALLLNANKSAEDRPREILEVMSGIAKGILALEEKL